MVVGELTEHTDVAIIGSGPGGYVAAIRAGRLGKMVTLIEKDSQGLGGICLHHGCIPSKALIHIANVFYDCTHAQEMGIKISNAQIDFDETQKFKDKVVAQLTQGIDSLLKKAGVDVVYGRASFEKSNQLHVEMEHDTMTLTADKIIIATGSKSAPLEQLPYNGRNIISSTEALAFESVPASLAIVGAGYIAVELSHVYQKLGAQVTMIQRSPRILNHLDESVSHIMAAQLQKFGVNIVSNTEVMKGDISEKNVKLWLKSKEGKESQLDVEKVLVATGRLPYVEGLGLGNTHVKLDESGYIPVDNKCQTSDPKILAIGDITGPPLLAHRGFYMGKIAAEVCAGLPSAYDAQVVPSVVYSDPEIAYVGLQENDAVKQGRQILTGIFPFSASGRAQGSARPLGFVKLVADPSSHLILGGLLVGSRVSELVSEIALAIEMGARLEDVAGTIHPHPTYGEAIAEAAEVALKKSVHVKRKFPFKKAEYIATPDANGCMRHKPSPPTEFVVILFAMVTLLAMAVAYDSSIHSPREIPLSVQQKYTQIERAHPDILFLQIGYYEKSDQPLYVVTEGYGFTGTMHYFSVNGTSLGSFSYDDMIMPNEPKPPFDLSEYKAFVLKDIKSNKW